MYRVPCTVCGVTVQSDTYKGAVFCGPSCEALHARREKHSNKPFTHEERHCETPEQKAIQRRALRKRGLK